MLVALKARGRRLPPLTQRSTSKTKQTNELDDGEEEKSEWEKAADWLGVRLKGGGVYGGALLGDRLAALLIWREQREEKSIEGLQPSGGA